MINPMNLTGKRIFITGASSGIGQETAILASRLGAKAVLIARREEQLKETLAGLAGSGHKYYCYNLSDVDNIEKLVTTVIAECGLIDGFVHSAGVGNYRPLKLMKPNFLKEVMEVNFYSFVELVRCMTKKGSYNAGMSIVGISSISSQQGNQSKIAYSASKAAMDAAIRCMAKELAPKQIRVNSIVPALIKTHLYDVFLNVGEGSEDAKNVMARQYLGLGEPIDIANMCAYLLSDASKFITGANIAVDGGRLSS